MLTLQRPLTVVAAMAGHASAASAYVAGGTALQLGWNQGQPLPQQLIDLSKMPQWRYISADDHELQIAAGVTLEQCRTDSRVQQQAPLLTQACAAIGALSIRNVGTLGGNLAWRQGDSIAVLMVLNARLLLSCHAQMRQQISVNEFLQPQYDGALLLNIAIERRQRHAFFEKVGYREAFTPTLVLVCGAFECDVDGRLHKVRLAISGAGLRARRLPSLEVLLEGCDPAATGWHAGFESCWRRLLTDDADISLLQRQVLQALLPGKLYACCRGLA